MVVSSVDATSFGRKYVEMGAAPLYEIRKGIKFGVTFFAAVGLGAIASDIWDEGEVQGVGVEERM